MEGVLERKAEARHLLDGSPRGRVCYSSHQSRENKETAKGFFVCLL